MLPRNGLWFLVLSLVNLAPLVWFSHLPSADGPAHVYNASLIPRYLLDSYDLAWKYVELNASIPPNLVAHGVQGLFTAFMKPEIAERMFVACYALLLPLALRYAIRGVSRESNGIEFLGLLLVFNWHLHWGFYNFLTGLIAYLFALGYWIRLRNGARPAASTAKLTALVTVLYFCHPVPLLAFWVTLASLVAVDAVRARSMRIEHFWPAAIASLPAAGLYLHYTLTRIAGPPVPVEWPTMRYAASVLLRLYPLATYTLVERLAALALSGLIVGGGIWAWATRAARNAANEYLCAAVLLALLVFVAPTQAAGGTLITARLVWFPLFLSLIWLGSVRWPAFWPGGIVVVAVVLSAAGQASRWPVYERYDARMRAFLDLAASRERAPVEFFQVATVSLPVKLDRTGTPELSSGAWGYVSASDAHVLLDYEPRVGYFPFRFHPGVDPIPYALPAPEGCSLAGGGLIDEGRYRRATGLRIDTQVVWVGVGDPDGGRCVRAYGKRVSAERQNADGTLLWFDADE